MVKVVEVIQELQAGGFMNSDRSARARILKSLSDGAITCQLDDTVRGVNLPEGPFFHQDEALAAIRTYWERCNEKLEGGGHWL